MLNINLDDETEKYLVEILAQEKTTSRELIKWRELPNSPGNLSDRDVRRQYIAEYLQKRHKHPQKQEA